MTKVKLKNYILYTVIIFLLYDKSESQSTGHWSGGRISWDRNSTCSGGRIFDHEIEIQFVYEQMNKLNFDLMKIDKKFDLMNKNNFDLMKKWISISWSSTSWLWASLLTSIGVRVIARSIFVSRL